MATDEGEIMEPKSAKDLERLAEELEHHIEILDEVSGQFDRTFGEWMDDFVTQEKLTKKKKKEMLITLLKQKAPQFVKTLNDFDLMIEAIGYRIEESKDKLQGKIDAIGEMEELMEEIEDKKRELDL